MNDTIHSVSAARTREAFNQVCIAMAALQHAKTTLADFHHNAKKVEDVKYLLDNLGKFACPSDDAHEMLFEQLNRAKQVVSDAESGDLWTTVKEDLEAAYKATDSAWAIIKKR